MTARNVSPVVDRSIPLVIAKVGQYPLHHGTVAAVRSLGRLGVPVYAVTEGPLAPTALSRYLARGFTWPTTGAEAPEELVAGLLRIGENVGRRSVLLVTDDRAAVLVAEHRNELEEAFYIPPVDRDLPGRLAGKQGLHDLCREFGVPTPRSSFPRTASELISAVHDMGLPAVVKTTQVWDRRTDGNHRQRPALKSTSILRSPEEVEAFAAQLAEWHGWDSESGGGFGSSGSGSGRRGGSSSSEDGGVGLPRDCVLVQEYLPHDPREKTEPPDWFTHFYCDADSEPQVMFTGVKLRSWPPGAGVTARGVSVAHPRLAAAAADLCRAIGYCGIGDLDWRFDQRDGQFKLVDFNPRMGAQFQLFRTTSGIDVVRALHLDLTGVRIPAGRQVDARELVVEHLNAGAALLERLGAPTTREATEAGRQTGMLPVKSHREPAWFAWDDPLPFAAATARFAADTVRLAWRHFRQ